MVEKEEEIMIISENINKDKVFRHPKVGKLLYLFKCFFSTRQSDKQSEKTEMN